MINAQINTSLFSPSKIFLRKVLFQVFLTFWWQVRNENGDGKRKTHFLWELTSFSRLTNLSRTSPPPHIGRSEKKKKSKILKDSCADSVVWAAFPFHSSSGRAGMLLLTLPTIPTGNWAGSWDTFGVPLLIPRLDSTAIQNLATLTLLEDLRLPALEASQHLESLWNSYCRTLSGHTSALDAPVSE